jgi:hypothetical protein
MMKYWSIGVTGYWKIGLRNKKLTVVPFNRQSRWSQ